MGKEKPHTSRGVKGLRELCRLSFSTSGQKEINTLLGCSLFSIFPSLYFVLGFLRSERVKGILVAIFSVLFTIFSVSVFQTLRINR